MKVFKVICIYVQRSRPANAAWESVGPLADGCAVARQYSGAVSR